MTPLSFTYFDFLGGHLSGILRLSRSVWTGSPDNTRGAASKCRFHSLAKTLAKSYDRAST